jgi:hypothetical protein
VLAADVTAIGDDAMRRVAQADERDLSLGARGLAWCGVSSGGSAKQRERRAQ